MLILVTFMYTKITFHATQPHVMPLKFTDRYIDAKCHCIAQISKIRFPLYYVISVMMSNMLSYNIFSDMISIH